MLPQAFFALALIGIVSAATDKIVCYHGSWATYRTGDGKFAVEDINPKLCTHVIYAFVGLETDGSIKHLDSYLDIDLGNLKRMQSLKKQNKNLKTLAAIGGWNEGSVKYSAVAADSAKRATLINSAIALLKKYDFDGFDLDWEYPAQRGGAAADKANFAILLKEFRAEFDKYGYLLTAAVAAPQGLADISYDIPALSKYLDFINIMAYDFHASWDGVTGQNAPLYASSIDVSASQKLLNVDAAVRAWIERGADPQKIILGVAAYGRSFTLASSSNNKLGAPASGAGTAGKYTWEAGMLGYNEIAELQSEGGWTTVWDDEQKNPFMYKGNQWVSYDNPQSITLKTQYAKALKLGGVMVWSIETDDFRGLSGVTFPLLRAINDALEKIDNPEDSNIVVESSSIKTSSSSASSGTSSVCTKVGYVRDPVVCSRFYYCLAHLGGFVPLELNCNAGLVFDEKTVSCDYPNVVEC